MQCKLSIGVQRLGTEQGKDYYYYRDSMALTQGQLLYAANILQFGSTWEGDDTQQYYSLNWGHSHLIRNDPSRLPL